MNSNPHSCTLRPQFVAIDFMKLFSKLEYCVCLPRYSLQSPHLTCLHFAKLLSLSLQVCANSIKAKNLLHPIPFWARFQFVQVDSMITYRPLPLSLSLDACWIMCDPVAIVWPAWARTHTRMRIKHFAPSLLVCLCLCFPFDIRVHSCLVL